MAHKLVIQLNVQSIDKAIQWVEKEKQKVLDTIHNFIQMLMDEGVNIAKAEVENIDTGETINSIHGMFINDNIGVIVAGGKAVFLEFGTGVDKNTFYPDPLPEGTTDGTHAIMPPKPSTAGGWFYPSTDTRYIRYYTSDGQGIAFTHGIRANRFMLYAKEHLTSIAPDWANRLFSGI